MFQSTVAELQAELKEARRQIDLGETRESEQAERNSALTAELTRTRRDITSMRKESRRLAGQERAGSSAA